MNTNNADYEYWAWDVEIPKGREVSKVPMYSDRMPTRPGYDRLGALRYAWSHLQSELLPHIRDLMDDGWEPITEVGPTAIKITTYNQTGGVGRFLMQFADPQWAIVGWCIKFRRVKGVGKVPVEMLDRSFNHK